MKEFLLILLTIPLITGVIGWVTNWAAVKMIFYPLKYIGIGPIGWQSIVAKQSTKFAMGVADVVDQNLLKGNEIAERINPADLNAVLGPRLDQDIRALAAEVGEIVAPGAWGKMAAPMQAMVVAQVKQKTQEITERVFEKAQPLVTRALDLPKLIFESLSGDNIGRMIRLTKYIGRNEFRFIEIYGGVFGFLIGLAQVGLWSLMQKWWLMPVVGAIVGLVTNWLAIQMIFRPQEPTKYFGLFTYQGLFPKRQADIAADYGKIASEEILTAGRLMELVIASPEVKQIAELIESTISETIDGEWQQAKAMMPVEVSDAQIAQAKAAIAANLINTFVKVRPELEAFLDQKLDVGETIKERMAAMPKDKFEQVLRGVFEEDEITLIVVGGVLGLAVGCLQAFLVLAIS
ncbi:MAG: DUF445 family protein [Deltaproteobacteria bacterium]|nr:DUF445 family protein [Deltaproteobacteria bacterium]